jgi:hypothetical protein
MSKRLTFCAKLTKVSLRLSLALWALVLCVLLLFALLGINLSALNAFFLLGYMLFVSYSPRLFAWYFRRLYRQCISPEHRQGAQGELVMEEMTVSGNPPPHIAELLLRQVLVGELTRVQGWIQDKVGRG